MDAFYYDISHPAGYASIAKLATAVKTSRKKALDYLQRQNTYTIHKPTRKKFPRRRILAYHVNELWQADLSDMQALSRHNKGYKYILVVTDVLSKKVWYHPLKSKRPAEVVVGFKKLFEEARPKLLFTDLGGEFYNATVKSLLDKHGIKLYSTYSGVKASQAERAIRTLKENLTKVFYHRGSKKYIDILPQLAQKYNSTRHSSTKIAPDNVNQENELIVFNRLFGNQKTTKPRYSVGDHVRAQLVKDIFEKGHTARFTDEIFKISQLKPGSPTVYYLEDLAGEPISGTFYEQELSKVLLDPDHLYDVEKVLKTRVRNGVKEYYVKFKGYSSASNQWVRGLHRK